MKLSNEYLMSNKDLELFGNFFQNSGEGIILFNDRTEIEMVNPRSLEMFLYEEKELIGRSVEVLIPQGVRDNHRRYSEQYIRQPRPRQIGVGRELEGLRKDNTIFPIEISLSHIKQKNELFIVAFISDITVRKENEKMVLEQQRKLKEYNLELEQMVKMRTGELEQINLGLQREVQERKLAENALKKSLSSLQVAEREILNSLEKEKELGELKSRFVVMASHEFKTPLTTILSSTSLIGKYTESDQQESREKHLKRIQNSVRNLTSILNDFLCFEKLKSGIHEVEKKDLNIHDLVNELIDEMTLKPLQYITHKQCKEEIVVVTDKHILKNILINLISNASKYSSEKEEIKIGYILNEQQVTITIQDRGIGIPRDEQKNLFDQFFRARNATNFQGTGLGLSIVKKYIDIISGKITFRSEEEKGSTFQVTLMRD